MVYLNNEYLKENEAKISVFDRGFIFGDGIYEVVPVFFGKLCNVSPFWDRFQQSLKSIGLNFNLSEKEVYEILNTLIQKNSLKEGGVYLQVTRGVSPRDFAFPDSVKPTFFAFTFEKEIINSPLAKTGIEAITTPDLRWKRRDIKSISLLAQVLSKQEAKKANVYEAIMIENDMVVEGSSSSVYIIKDGVLITRALSEEILAGIRRKILLEIAKDLNLQIKLRAFSVEEMKNADEVFITSATTVLYSVVKIDKKPIKDAKVGKIATMLRQKFIQRSINEA